jgi:hypothetical protein
MTTISLDNAGKYGLLQDITVDAMPVEGWNVFSNIRCLEQVLKSFGVDTEVYITGGGEAPVFFFYVPDPISPYWLAASNGKLYKVTTSSHLDVSKVATTYSGSNTSVWSGFDFHRHQIMNVNSGVDFPQVLDPGASNFVDLDFWPANTYCQFIAPYKNFLIAYGITEGASTFFNRIKWSDLADAGALPGSWDETDLTTLAGESDEADKGGGSILTAKVLKDVNFIYKSNAIWYMYPRNDLRVFNIKEFDNERGILGAYAITEFEEKHYFVSQGDVLVNDGRTVKSIIDKRNKKFLFNNLSDTYYAKVVVVANAQDKEIWVCYPDTSSTGELNRALVYNVVEDSWGFRELNDFSYLANGVIDTSTVSQIIDDDAGIIDQDSSIIDAVAFNPSVSDLLAGRALSSQYFFIDDVAGGAGQLGSFERHGLTVVGRDRFGEWKYSSTASKQVTRVYPKFTGIGSFNVSVGVSKTPDGAITWSAPETYTIGGTPHVDFFNVTGEAISLKFESLSSTAWSYSGCEIEMNIIAENTF